MDHSTLLKIARLRTMAARQGRAFDVVRFATDRAFARETLTRVLDTDDEQVLTLGLELMDALQMVVLDRPATAVAAAAAADAPTATPVQASGPAPAPGPAAAVTPVDPLETTTRFIGRPR